MAKLIHKRRGILSGMKYTTGIFGKMIGLMFSSEANVRKGICMVIDKRDSKSFVIHMLFCFYAYDVLFVDSRFRVVDKTILKPWSYGYAPKKPCKYVIESWAGTFRNIKIREKIEIRK